MKKRIFSLLLVVLICLTCVPAMPVWAYTTSEDGLWCYDMWNKTIVRYYGNAEHLTIPSGIDGLVMNKIGKGAFRDCTSLKTVKMKTEMYISDEAFQGCTNLESIELKVIDPPNFQPEIGYRAFENCKSLRSIELPDNVVINDNAFKGCTSLKTVQLPKSVKLGKGVFAGCTGLDGIWAHPDSATVCNDEYGVLFNKDKTELLEAPGGLVGTYVVPDTVTRISRYAFYGCDKLETVIIPDSVTDMGLESFQYCTALHTAVLSGYYRVQQGQFKGCSALDTIVISGTMGKEIYADCTGLKSIYCLNPRTDHNPIALNNVKATVYYYEPNAKVYQEELQACQLGGELTWVPLDSYCVAKGDGSSYSVGSDIGAIFFMMAPKEKLSAVYVDGTRLTTDQYMPMTYGTTVILKDAYLQTLSLGQHKLKVAYIGGSCEATFTLNDEPVCRHEVTEKKAKEPTCTKDGNTAGSYCKKCDKVFDQWQVIPALGHDYQVTTVEPTCTENGCDLYMCSRCGKTKQDKETEPLGHDFVVTTVPPTCLELGYEVHICARCQLEERHNEVEATGHIYGEWETVKEPTTEETGLQQRKCQNCDAAEERELETLPPEPTAPPTQPPTQVPAEPTIPASAAPEEPVSQEPVNLKPFILLGVVLLVVTSAGVLYLFRKKS